MRRLIMENHRAAGAAGSEAPRNGSEPDTSTALQRTKGAAGGEGGAASGQSLMPRPAAPVAVPDDVVPERFVHELPPEFKQGIPSEAIALVKPSAARANGLLPYRFDPKEKELYIALAEEPDTARRQAIDYTLNASARGLTLKFTPLPEEFQQYLTRLIDNYYPPFAKTAHGASGGRRTGEAKAPSVTARYGFSQTLGLDARELHARAAGTPKDYVDYVLKTSAELDCSDVMIDRFRHHTRIKVMLDGRGYLFDTPMEGDVCEKSIRVLKNECDMPTTKVKRPRGGSFKGQAWIKGELKDLRFRCEFSPSGEHERVTVRIHTGKECLVDLDSEDIDERSRQELKAIEDADQGIYPVVGRVGEGKSTTLHAVALRINRIERPIASLQDPIEFDIEDIAALDIREHGLSFEEGLTSVLRWGMPITLLGEIRNPEVARIALEGVRGGHLIMTTFHAPDSVGAINRLAGRDGLGWTPGDIADTMPAIFAQRLLPKLCTLCKEPVQYSEEELILAGFDPVIAADGQFFQPGRDKCGACRNGFAGRVLIIETLRINNLIREILYENRAETLERDVRRAAIEDGLIPLRESALRAVANGKVWLTDAMKKTHWHQGDFVTRGTQRVYERHAQMTDLDRTLGASSGIGADRTLGTGVDISARQLRLAAGDPRDAEPEPNGDTSLENSISPDPEASSPESPVVEAEGGPEEHEVYDPLGIYLEDADEQCPPTGQRAGGVSLGNFILTLDEGDASEEGAEPGSDDTVARMSCAAD